MQLEAIDSPVIQPIAACRCQHIGINRLVIVNLQIRIGVVTRYDRKDVAHSHSIGMLGGAESVGGEVERKIDLSEGYILH